MKTTLKIIRFIYLVIAYTLLSIIGLISYPIREFLKWYFLIDESWLTQAPQNDFVDMKIRQNKRINLRFLYRWNDKVIENLNNKIDE